MFRLSESGKIWSKMVCSFLYKLFFQTCFNLQEVKWLLKISPRFSSSRFRHMTLIDGTRRCPMTFKYHTPMPDKGWTRKMLCHITSHLKKLFLICVLNSATVQPVVILLIHAGMRKLPMTVRLHWARNRMYLQQATRYSCQVLSWSG